MIWDIDITEAAQDDLRDIFAYIAGELRAPDDARRIVRNILAGIQTLDEMPERFRPYPRKPIASRGVRVCGEAHLMIGTSPSQNWLL